MRIAAEALRVRAAVCTLLGRPKRDAAAAWQTMATCPPQALDLFLRLERCAIVVRARLAERGLTEQTAPPLMALINDRATRELQRSLSARAQLQRIVRLTQAHDWKVIVLKGGVTIAHGGQVDVLDIDVLMEAEPGIALAGLLDVTGSMSPQTVALHHLSPRYSSDAITIEIHHLLPQMPAARTLLDNAIRIERIPGLWQLAPTDHIWHTLVHATLQHPERRGNIRDAAILAHALSACTSEERATIQRQVEKHPEAETLRAMLVLAETFSTQQFTTDPFADSALRKYTFCDRYDGQSTGVRERAVRFLCTDRSFARALREDMALTHEIPATFAPINWLNQKVPRLGILFRQTLRVGRLGLVAVLTVQNVWDVRRVIKERRPA